MSEFIKSRATDEFVDMQTRIAALEHQLRDAREENAMLRNCMANKDGIIKGLAYAVRCNGVSGNEVGGLEA